MTNQIHETLGVPVAYVVANPSGYAYLDPERPDGDGKEFQLLVMLAIARPTTTGPMALNGRSGYSAKIRTIN
jgi:hypothetical protein